VDIAPYIDHTALKPVLLLTDIEQLCTEAAENGFAAVCVPPCFVGYASDLLKGSAVSVATVIAFPFGYQVTEVKLDEIKLAMEDGAQEIDLVHNIAALKNDDWDYLEQEIPKATFLTHELGGLIKVIVESGLLTDDELIKCCELYSRYPVDFLKTSTGFAEVGATVHAVSLMRAHLPEHIGIKASGGIRNFTFAKELIEAGASRIGCSASMQILAEAMGNVV
jgi:deoxyribose-phosphate aldolase